MLTEFCSYLATIIFLKDTNSTGSIINIRTNSCASAGFNGQMETLSSLFQELNSMHMTRLNPSICSNLKHFSCCIWNSMWDNVNKYETFTQINKEPQEYMRQRQFCNLNIRIHSFGTSLWSLVPLIHTHALCEWCCLLVKNN